MKEIIFKSEKDILRLDKTKRLRLENEIKRNDEDIEDLSAWNNAYNSLYLKNKKEQEDKQALSSALFETLF